MDPCFVCLLLVSRRSSASRANAVTCSMCHMHCAPPALPCSMQSCKATAAAALRPSSPCSTQSCNATAQAHKSAPPRHMHCAPAVPPGYPRLRILIPNPTFTSAPAFAWSAAEIAKPPLSWPPWSHLVKASKTAGLRSTALVIQQLQLHLR